MRKTRHNSHRCIQTSLPIARRRGVALLFVLVVVAALGLAVYSFSRSSVTHLAGLRSQREYIVQRLLAESAIESALAKSGLESQALGRMQNTSAGSNGDATKIHSMDLGDGQVGEFALVSSLPLQNGSFEFGYQNESAKLNLNSLVTRKLNREQIVEKLITTPGVSNSIAEGICDKLGVKRRMRNESGGTRSTSTSQSNASPRLEDLSDLLSVPGVTASLLYGEDQNRNGLLDKNENDGSKTLPPDNADGKLDSGWAGVWSVDAGESNFREGGKLKINLNQSDLVDLHDRLSSEFGADIARFVVAWKSSSPIYTDAGPISEEQAKKESAAEREASFEDRVRMQLGGDNPTSPAPNSPPGSPPDSNASNGSAAPTSSDSGMRSGILLQNGRGRKIKSPLDLIGCKVQVMINGKDEVLVSPFASDPASVHRWLVDWEQKTTTTDGPVLEGRININQAAKSTLMTIDGMTDAIAESIIKFRATQKMDSFEFATVGWLLTRSIVSSAQLRQMAPQMTTGGSITSGIAIGQLRSSQTAAATHYTIDARIPPARIVRYRELDTLPFYSRLPRSKP